MSRRTHSLAGRPIRPSLATLSRWTCRVLNPSPGACTLAFNPCRTIQAHVREAGWPFHHRVTCTYLSAPPAGIEPAYFWLTARRFYQQKLQGNSGSVQLPDSRRSLTDWQLGSICHQGRYLNTGQAQLSCLQAYSLLNAVLEKALGPQHQEGSLERVQHQSLSCQAERTGLPR